jgi:uncharacterized protein (TIGR02246 family)
MILVGANLPAPRAYPGEQRRFEMVDHQKVVDWVEAYKHAWSSNAPEDIAALFTEDALYYTGPFDSPWKGREMIVKDWLGRKDEPDSYTFRYEVLALGDDLGVVRGWTEYTTLGKHYSNIWLIRFGEQGRCREFTEWWMKKK